MILIIYISILSSFLVLQNYQSCNGIELEISQQSRSTNTFYHDLTYYFLVEGKKTKYQVAGNVKTDNSNNVDLTADKFTLPLENFRIEVRKEGHFSFTRVPHTVKLVGEGPELFDVWTMKSKCILKMNDMPTNNMPTTSPTITEPTITEPTTNTSHHKNTKDSTDKTPSTEYTCDILEERSLQNRQYEQYWLRNNMKNVKNADWTHRIIINKCVNIVSKLNLVKKL